MFFSGLAFGLSLLIAIGAQNAFVLRQGIMRQHVFVVALICALSDAALIAIGVSGIGIALHGMPALHEIVRWVGVGFLTCYALLALRRAWRPAAGGLSGHTSDPDEAEEVGVLNPSPDSRLESGATTATLVTPATARRSGRLVAVALTTLAITWLNPHVYLDTVFLLGSVAQSQGAGRWIFTAGAVTASFAWFFALAYGARSLGKWLSSARAWQIIDLTTAVVMLAIAATLAFRF